MKQKRQRTNPPRAFSAMEKAQAVLAVWTERRKPSEMCKEMEIKWGILNHWQNQALEGMLKGLEGRNSKDKKAVPAIGERLKKLLDKKMTQHEKMQDKLRQRLSKIQEKSPSPQESPSAQKK